MRDSIRSLAMLAGIVVVAFASPASAQDVKKGTVSGVAFAASASANSSTVPLYTAPASGGGFAMITAICGLATYDTGLAYISGSTLGVVGIGLAGAGTGCTQIPTGLPLPAGEVLSYVNNQGVTYGVTIVGVISSK